MTEPSNSGAEAPVSEAALMAQVTKLLSQLTARDRKISRIRPKAIMCRKYSFGDDWPEYMAHFKACITATYDFELPTDEDQLEEACLLWLPSNIEPGPALTVYEALTDDDKSDWDRLVTALTDEFEDKSEREGFLSDSGYFLRGNRSLHDYKHRILSLMNKYQPELENIPTEFQRQSTQRFIEGLEDDRLRRKLRLHCKRDKLNINEAFRFAIDYESTESPPKVRENTFHSDNEHLFGAIEVHGQPGQSENTQAILALQTELNDIDSRIFVVFKTCDEWGEALGKLNNRLDEVVQSQSLTVSSLQETQESLESIKDMICQSYGYQFSSEYESEGPVG